MIAQVEDGTVICFDCYKVKDYLKRLGFRWDPERKVWYKIKCSKADLEYLRDLGFEILFKPKKEINEELVSQLRAMYPYAFKHQLVGASLAIEEKSFLIGDEPGVGKTLEAIIYFDYLLFTKKLDYGILMCPSSIKRQWRDEVYRFIGKTPYILEGTPAQRRRTYELFSSGRNYPLLIANYELLLRDDFFEFLKDLEANAFALILDEASRIKNRQSKTFKRLKDIARRTEYKLALTGTPIENSLMELWAIAHLLRGREFMTFKEFEQEHVRYYVLELPNRSYPIKKVAGYRNIAKFVARVAPFYIRRKKSDVREDLPPLIEQVREIELTPLQKAIEEELVHRARKEKGIALEGVMQLLRIVGDDPRLLKLSTSEIGREIYFRFKDQIDGFKTNRKIEELENLLQEHEGKIIVFTSFSNMAGILARHFKALLITGQTEARERARILGEFKSREDRRVLIATDALTYGASLDEADTVVHFDIPWSVGKLVQRTDRIHRITSTRNKTVYYFVSSGIESKVWEILQNKVKLFKDVVEGEALGNFKREILTLIKGIKGITTYNKI